MGYALIDALRRRPTSVDKDAFAVAVAPSRSSDSIFRDYLIPFEVVSVLLLAALIGAIVLARRE